MRQGVTLFVFVMVMIFIPQQSYAGKIADTFSDGIFSVPWGSTIEEVQKKFPDGKMEKPLATVHYSIKDGRRIFNIPREDDNAMTFLFNSEGHLNSASIEFPYHDATDLGQLMANLDTYFGEHLSDRASDTVLMEWPEDKGIRINLGYIPGIFSLGQLVFGIHYEPSRPHKITKEEMGLD